MDTIKKIIITAHQTVYGYRITTIAVFEHRAYLVLSDIFLVKPRTVLLPFEEESIWNGVLDKYIKEEILIELFLPARLKKRSDFVKNIRNIFRTQKIFVYKEYDREVYNDLVADEAHSLLLKPAAERDLG